MMASEQFSKSHGGTQPWSRTVVQPVSSISSAPAMASV